MPLTLATTTPGEPEIFASLQGEGLSAGRPCAFVRLSRCNLACIWCDTAYTWRFTGDNRPHVDGVEFAREGNQIVLEEDEVARRVLSLRQDRLVITGGEPLLQGWGLSGFITLLKEAWAGLHVEVETNGTVPVKPHLDLMIDQYNVSPKLAHSGNRAELALDPARLDAWAMHPRAWFKFVIAEPDDVDEVLALVQRHAIAHARVFLMPEGRDPATLAERARWLAPLCLAHGFAYSGRLHIGLYGDTRGT